MVCCDPTLPFLHCLSNPGSQGGWSFSQLSRVRGKVYMLNMLPVIRRLTHRHTHSHLQPIYNNKHIFSVTIFVKRTAFLLCSLKRIISFPEISNTYSFMNEHGFTKTTLCECRSMKEPTKLSHFSSFTWSLAAVVEHEKISSSDWLVGPLTAGACTEVSRSQPASSCSHYSSTLANSCRAGGGQWL